MLGFKGIHTQYGTNAFVTEGGLQFLSKYTLIDQSSNKAIWQKLR